MRLGRVVGLATLLLSWGPTQSWAQAACASASGQAYQRVLAETWDMVGQRFYDPAMDGVDWARMLERYQPLACAASTDADLGATINAMLAELGASHTGYYAPDDPAYFQLLDIFLGGDRRGRLNRLFPNGRVSYPGIGVFTRAIEGRVFVTGVWDGAPGAKAGLMVGDEILAVDGAAFAPVGSFVGKVGRETALTLRRVAGGPILLLVVTPADIEPNQAFLDALKASVRMYAQNGTKIGYLRPWSYARPQIQAAIIETLSTGPLKDVDALILDLRDGWGGAQSDYINAFIPDGPLMTLRGRDQVLRYDSFRWQRPLVVLINGGTRSGKEYLAYAIQRHKLGRLVGERSAGALLAGSGFLLSNDALLEIAVAEVWVDGARLESVGVSPDIDVPFDIRYAGGKDPQLERALDILSKRGGD
ncbi:MAG: peptidase S41 [Alphaproteobacteria bacterium]|nr:peptidase S41 [Alphaproteobacteria bacterium]